jgi:hypothetical protein
MVSSANPRTTSTWTAILSKGKYQFNKPLVMSPSQAIQTFGVLPKTWNKIIEDLVLTYLQYLAKNGLDSINKPGNKRL